MMRRFLAVLATIAVAAGLAIAVPQAAQAFPWQAKICSSFASCNAQGRGNAGYQDVYTQSFWSMYGGHNCVNYVAYRLQQNGIAKFTVTGQGNATNWGSAAAAKGIAVNKSNPQPGDVAWFTQAQIGVEGGHVAYVESVNLAAGTFTVSEDNWGGDFDWRQYNIGDVSGFIHVAKPVTPPAPPVVAGTSNGGKAITSSASGRCMDVNGGGTANSTQVWLFDCNNSPAQQWVYSGGALHIFGNVPRCLDVSGGIYQAGQPVQSFECNGSPAQQWSVNGDGTISSQGWCLDADAGTINVSGTKLQIWQCISGGINQQWRGLRVINSGAPSVTGTVQVGHKLTATAGRWATSGATLSYMWKADGLSIVGANKSTFTVTGGFYKKAISVRVTGSGSGLISTAVESSATAKVTAGKLTTGTPTIHGILKKGVKVTAKPGTWTSSTAFTYRWYRDGKAINGAVKSYHTLVAADVKHHLTVKVTGKKTGYSTVTKASKATKAIAAK